MLKIRLFSVLGLFCATFITVGCQNEGNKACENLHICPAPQAPALSVIAAFADPTAKNKRATVLQWHSECFPDDAIQVGVSTDLEAKAPKAWNNGNTFTLSGVNLPYSIKLFARIYSVDCIKSDVFSHVYRVQAEYPPAAGKTGSSAVGMDDPRLTAWATGWVDPIRYGEDLDDKWKTPKKALGPATGASDDVVSLGEGGEIIMTFDPPIRDRDGWDFAVFENSLNDTFLELAFVEVSSNGSDFTRFDSAYLGKRPVGQFGEVDAELVGSLAGAYRGGWGAPFDLKDLANKPEVGDGSVNLDRIKYVKIVDIVGDGWEKDSFGNAIYDPYPTEGSAGFDLDAIGVFGDASR